MDLFITLLLLAPTALATDNTQNIEYCDSLQYAEYGKTGTIECFFLEGFYGVFWFNSTDHINQYPLVTLKKSVKGGYGYDSGEFDIYPNGSLIINNVLSKHEHNYTVFKLDSVKSKILPLFIFLNVTENLIRQPCKSQQFLELGKTGFLECSFTKPFFGIFWFDSIDHVNNFPVAILKESVKSGDGYLSGEYDIGPHGSLIINKVSPLHEKTFTVFKLETVDDEVVPMFINVVVYALPVPLHPIINDCHHQQCVFEIRRNGSLQCAVHGIRPIVKLLWKLANEETLQAVTFFNKNYTIETRGDVYDVVLTSSFVVNETSVTRLDVECCIVFETRNDLFNLTSTAHLLLLTDTNLDDGSSDSSDKKNIWIATVVVTFLLICAIIAAVLVLYWKGKRSEDVTDGQQMNFIPSKKDIKAYKKEVIEELRKHYRELYSKVQYAPLRSIKCPLTESCLKSVIHLMIESDDQECGGKKYFRPYHTFFSDHSFKGKTYVLQGDSGCGKSSFVLQLAYDWCKKPKLSARQNVEIVILLPFGQFGSTTSMYEAINKIYFCENSEIDETKLETILSESSHVLLIFDGYDEYPGDIINSPEILKTSLSQKKNNFTVIITSRSSLEEECVPEGKKALSLRACTTDMRDNILSQHKEKKQANAVQKIKSDLREHPLLDCLCNIPLFFFLFMDVYLFEENNFQSVLQFFKDIMFSFQIQVRNGHTEEVNAIHKLFGESYVELGEETFRELKLRNDTNVWLKEELMERFGSDFYNMLKQMALLVEEDITTQDDEPVSYVKLCHIILHEWFAANYISNKIESDSNNIECILKGLRFIDMYYFYFFLLELNEKSIAEKILKLLEKRDDFREFVILYKKEKGAYEEEALKLINDYVSEEIKLSFDDSRMKQQFIICIMEIASSLNTPIVSLLLDQNFGDVSSRNIALYLRTGLLLPILSSLKELRIDEKGRRSEEDETVSVFKFATECRGITILRFSHCLLPFEIEKDALPDKKVEVTWAPVLKLTVYTLMFDSGQWQRKGSPDPLTDREYQNIEKTFQE